MSTPTFSGEGSLADLDLQKIREELQAGPTGEFDIKDFLKSLIGMVLHIQQFCEVQWMNPDYTVYLHTGYSLLSIRIVDNENESNLDLSSWYLFGTSSSAVENLILAAIWDYTEILIGKWRNDVQTK